VVDEDISREAFCGGCYDVYNRILIPAYLVLFKVCFSVHT
jgi:hypothetical protein